MGTSRVKERLLAAEPEAGAAAGFAHPEVTSESTGSFTRGRHSREDVEDQPAGRPSVISQIFRPIGWISIVGGLVLLELAAFLFWGTGMKTAAAQTELRNEFAQIQQSAARGTFKRPVNGESIARLVIPRLGLDMIVVEGVGHEELTRGPGHMPETAFPGSNGSSVISGHRTTYASPFSNIDQLEPGDEIRVITAEGESVYSVTKSYVILPVDTSVTLPLAPGEKPRLRLTTCHPRFSAAQRLIVEADRIQEPRL
ncbi:MAG: class E sortase [Acidobacteria bacterium]|nr:MAG: class E sortase [Acidobacteriota bacterium]